MIWKFASVSSFLIQNFKAEKLTLANCNREDAILGPRPCLQSQLLFVRKSSFYVMTKYLPSFIVVMMSFGSFFVPVVAVAARVALLIASLLSLVIVYEFSLDSTIFAATINLWMFFCLLFVFGAIVEFFFAIRQYTKSVQENRPYETGEKDEIAKMSALKMDYYSRFAFPGLFILFVIIYAIVFTAIHGQDTTNSHIT